MKSCVYRKCLWNYQIQLFCWLKFPNKGFYPFGIMVGHCCQNAWLQVDEIQFSAESTRINKKLVIISRYSFAHKNWYQAHAEWFKSVQYTRNKLFSESCILRYSTHAGNYYHVDRYCHRTMSISDMRVLLDQCC